MTILKRGLITSHLPGASCDAEGVPERFQIINPNTMASVTVDDTLNIIINIFFI